MRAIKAELKGKVDGEQFYFDDEIAEEDVSEEE
jgi:hypothetical protein